MRDDRQRLRLRRLRGARLHARRALPDHPRRLVLRPARPAAVPDRAWLGWTAWSPGSSATSGPPTASGRPGSWTGSSSSPTHRTAGRSSSQRDSEALLLLIPDAGGRGRGILSGKVFEYLAAERPILAVVPPDGAAADADRARRAPGSSSRPTTSTGSSASSTAHARPLRARATLEPVELGDEWRTRLSRRTRVAGARRPARARSEASAHETSSRASSSWRRSSAAPARRSTGPSPAASSSRTSSRSASSSPTSRSRGRASPRTSAVLLGFFGRLRGRLPDRLLQPRHGRGALAVRQGDSKFVIQFSFLALAVTWLWRRGVAYYWRALGWFCGGMVGERDLRRRSSSLVAAGRREPRSRWSSAAHRRRKPDQHLRHRQRLRRSSAPNALTDDPNHLGIMLIVPLLVLTPLYLRLERGHRLPPPPRRCLIAFLLVVEVATLSRSGLLGLGVGALILRLPYRGYLRSRALIAPLARRARRARRRRRRPAPLLPRRHPLAPQTRRRPRSRRTSRSTASSRRSCTATRCFGLGLNTFSIYYQFVTGKTNWGPHSFYVSLIVETGIVGTVALRVLPRSGSSCACAVARRLGRALARAGDPLAARVRAARLGLDGGARRDAGRERLLPDDAVLLLLRLPRARARRAARLRARREPAAPCRARRALRLRSRAA